ncbi:MAG: hypothetical protein ACKVHX_00780 [Alphaproteobacteria bacterium]|jgi:hypothetical protein
MDLNLCWRGPVGAGNFPTDPNAVDAINEAGIYLRLKLYQGDRTIAYVGQSGHLMMRFDQHLTRLLSLHQPLRDASGQIVVEHGPENRFLALNEIITVAPLAIEEVLRTRFYFALAEDGFDVDYLTLIEAMLKARAEDIMHEQPENIQSINPGEFDHEILVVSDFSNVDAAGCRLIESVIGDTAIEIPSTQELFANAD